ncbi:hypothetical protein [Sphingomonas endolithica]|uniref:hypothetical protein n=1 Tax=Sphingomonas endolithica TaxID=2972485 RepID=UPI0021AF1A26|nr:hypothetical protein [Sphingomonas sp. ZFBP2030]
MTRKTIHEDIGALDEERIGLRVQIALMEERGGNYAELLERRERLRVINAQITTLRGGKVAVAVAGVENVI